MSWGKFALAVVAGMVAFFALLFAAEAVPPWVIYLAFAVAVGVLVYPLMDKVAAKLGLKT
jgi:hypothetical protein